MAPPVVFGLRRPFRALGSVDCATSSGWQCRTRASGDDVAVTKPERIDQDVLHRRAQVAVLSGLTTGDDVYELTAAVAPSHVPGWFTPDLALLELAVTALDLACPVGAEAWSTRGCASAICRG